MRSMSCPVEEGWSVLRVEGWSDHKFLEFAGVVESHSLQVCRVYSFPSTLSIIDYYIFLQWEYVDFSSPQTLPAHLVTELALSMHFTYGTYWGRHSPRAWFGILKASSSYSE